LLTERTDSRVKIGKNMNYYDKLEDDHRAWSVCEAAHFLGYNKKYVYELIREGKIEGWFEVNGSYRFCPAKLKAWLEKKLGNERKEPKVEGLDDGPSNKPGQKDDDENRVA
jgi:excisionase family DNA binding protein